MTEAVRLTRWFPAPPARAWRCWTDPAELGQWWRSARVGTTYELDLRVGGRYRLASTELEQGWADCVERLGSLLGG